MQRCRAGAEQEQSRCRGGEEVVKRCRGAERHRGSRAGSEVLKCIGDEEQRCRLIQGCYLPEFYPVLPGFTRFFLFYSQRHGKSQFTVWVKVHFGYRVKPFV